MDVKHNSHQPFNAKWYQVALSLFPPSWRYVHMQLLIWTCFSSITCSEQRRSCRFTGLVRCTIQLSHLCTYLSLPTRAIGFNYMRGPYTLRRQDSRSIQRWWRLDPYACHWIGLVDWFHLYIPVLTIYAILPITLLVSISDVSPYKPPLNHHNLKLAFFSIPFRRYRPVTTRIHAPVKTSQIPWYREQTTVIEKGFHTTTVRSIQTLALLELMGLACSCVKRRRWEINCTLDAESII